MKRRLLLAAPLLAFGLVAAPSAPLAPSPVAAASCSLVMNLFDANATNGANVNPGGVATSLAYPGYTNNKTVAIDVKTGKLKGEKRFPWALYSGALGTAGDLVFTAQIDGKIMALDKDSLDELWSFEAGTTIAAPPITYAVNGKQYVAVVANDTLHVFALR